MSFHISPNLSKTLVVHFDIKKLTMPPSGTLPIYGVKVADQDGNPTFANTTVDSVLTVPPSALDKPGLIVVTLFSPGFVEGSSDVGVVSFSQDEDLEVTLDGKVVKISEAFEATELTVEVVIA